MGKYIIKATETLYYEILVEADSKDHAKELFYTEVNTNLDDHIENADFNLDSIEELN